MTDQVKKQAGPADSLSKAEKQVNKRRTHKVRRQFDQSYLDPNSIKSDLVRSIEHPEDMHQNRFNPYW